MFRHQTYLCMYVQSVRTQFPIGFSFSHCWYLDNSIMMVEEYQADKLLNGKYYRKGDSVPISRVIDGVGSAHIYDKDGILMRKISYYNGNPVE